MIKEPLTVNVAQDDGTTKEVKLYVIRPSNETIKNADRYRAKTWNQCVADGVLTKKELAKLFKERKIWDDDKDTEKETIVKTIHELEKTLFLGKGEEKPKLSDGQKIAIEMRKLRIQLQQLIAERIAMEENTAESLADNARFDYFVADCVFHENGQKVYSSVADYLQKAADEVAYAAAAKLGEMLYQLDAKYEENLPENQWLKKFNLVNSDLDLVNRDGTTVDTDGRRINDKGHYINEEGKRVDRDGVPLNDDGTYIISDKYVDDLSPKTEVVTKKPKKASESKLDSVV